jgi:hypothetical protein
VVQKELLVLNLQEKLLMKIRFEKNSLRLRVRKSDVAELKQQGFITESVEMPGNVLTYELRISDVTEPQALFKDNAVVTTIPRDIATEWLNTDEVGIYHMIPLGNNRTLELVIEKDFPCKDRPEEDRSDTFTELANEQGSNETC